MNVKLAFERVGDVGVAVGDRHGDETVSVAEKTILHVKRAPDERGVDDVRVLDGERVCQHVVDVGVCEVIGQVEGLRSGNVVESFRHAWVV